MKLPLHRTEWHDIFLANIRAETRNYCSTKVILYCTLKVHLKMLQVVSKRHEEKQEMCVEIRILNCVHIGSQIEITVL